MPAGSESESSESSPWKYLPFELGECEDLENYETGGFHPVHLGDVFDGRYRIIHELGFGGFSTVWLARDALTNRWVTLKIDVARESPTYEARTVIAGHSSITESHLFAVVDRKFWFDGSTGGHLCLVSPVLGPDLSKLSKGIYTRMKPPFAREVSRLAAQALALLHSNGLCHGDFTVNNMALRLKDEFCSYGEDDLLRLFRHPQIASMRTYSGESSGPQAPNYIVVPLNFCSSKRSVSLILINRSRPQTRQRIDPAFRQKYLAPEVAIGRPPSMVSDVWALGCAIFRIRSGDDVFFDYDTDCPADALRQIVKSVGELPEELKQTRFDDEGCPIVEGHGGELFWILEETQPRDNRVRAIVDESVSSIINRRGQAVELEEEPEPAIFEDDAARRVPYPAVLGSMVWKPTAICVDGSYFAAYSDETDGMLAAFPKITESAASLLIDLLSKIFTYEPGKRITAEELVTHPWFHFLRVSG